MVSEVISISGMHKHKLSQFLKGTGYNLKTDVFFMPVAAQSSLNIKDRLPKENRTVVGGPVTA